MGDESRIPLARRLMAHPRALTGRIIAQIPGRFGSREWCLYAADLIANGCVDAPEILDRLAFLEEGGE